MNKKQCSVCGNKRAELLLLRDLIEEELKNA